MASPASHHQQSQTPQSDPLAVLGVFDRLEIGPVRLEAKRLVAPYRLYYDDHADQTELIYTFEERVFAPKEAESRNLADMMAAQVALNYGLFCNKIVFHGTYDEADRRFLREMAENTAREIYVKKFLEPNPFLIGPAAHLPAVKQKKYLRARLLFVGNPQINDPHEWRLWDTRGKLHCVLSSGGKDSLLSYGLLNELGYGVHPIFINESGRHWFTALNAYRHFKEAVADTARVWVNSDRVFNWMLRRMPFIRKDFADVRADEYPIRLWTVAVFIFGVLPLMRKRGIGRLVIGDEFDTSRHPTHAGIAHYDGLYDQSVWFDSAMSRYFMRKGWSICQFSVLRPLSELLIEIILAKRYPHLQAHQTSCHAAHKDGDRIKPCGKCEKCRRIVAMLTAVGEDPRRCGYSDAQIIACLNAIAKPGYNAQAAAEATQLLWMLTQNGHIQPSAQMRAAIQPQPETMSLRFDSGVSPMNAIPLDLRESVYRICLEYAQAAVKRTGRRWKQTDLFAEPEFQRPHAFEMDRSMPATPLDPEASDAKASDYLWQELCWPDAEQAFKTVDTVLLPVGALEQHGPHLPLDTDAFDADYLARRVAEACSPPRPMVLPLISYGVSYHHDDFKGTVSIDNDTLSRLVYDIGMSVAKNGFKKLVIINGHGGNAPALNYAAQMINRDARIFVCVDTGETSDVDIDALVETPNDVHAGEIETSTSLAIRPRLVKTERMKKAVPRFSSRYLDFSSKRGISWYAHTQKISADGVMGDPTRASREKGEKMWAVMIAHLVAFVETLKSMTLEEIYHRRY